MFDTMENWLGGLIGRPVPPPPAAAGGAPAPAAAAPGAMPNITLKGKYTIPPFKTKAWNGKIDIIWKGEVALEATTGAAGDAAVELNANQDSIGYEATQTIWESKCKAHIAGVDIFANPKLATKGAINTKEGVEVKTVFTVDIPIGKIGISGTLLAWKPGKEPEAGTVSGSLEIDAKIADTITVRTYSVHGIKLSGTVEAAIAPEYLKIIADEIFDRLKKEAAKQAAKTVGETAAEGLGEDAVVTMASVDMFAAAMTTALAAVAIGTVAATVKSFVQHLALKNITVAINGVYASLHQGFDDGLAGKPSAAKDDLYNKAFEIGHGAFQAAMDQVGKMANLTPPDDMMQMAQDAAKKAGGAFRAKIGEIDNTIRWEFFYKWVDDNHGLGTYEGDVQDAILAIFGIGNEPATGEHMKYWASKSSLPNFMKT